MSVAGSNSEPLVPHARAIIGARERRSQLPSLKLRGCPNQLQLASFTPKSKLRRGRAADRRALAIDEPSYGPDHPDVAIRLNNLAQLLQATNRPAEAEPLMRRALAIDEPSYGPDHPDVAIRLNNLALLLQATNRLAEAEPLLRRALAIDEQSYGPDHPNVATDLNNLASCCRPPTGWPRPSR